MSSTGIDRQASSNADAVPISAGPQNDAPPNEPMWINLLRRWRWVLIAFVASRLIIAFLTRLSRMIFEPGEFWQRNGITGMLTQGDGERYLQIASSGYGAGEAALAHVGFFPLYPALIRIFSVVFDPPMAAMVISNIAVLAAGILLKELVDLQYRQSRVSNAAVTFLMFSPLSFLFSGAYPEATFLVLTLGAFFAASTRRWMVASLCGMAAALTSSIGVLIALPLALEFLRNGEPSADPSPRRVQRMLLLALVPLGCAAFLFFSYSRFGDAFAPFRGAPALEGGLAAPWTTVSTTELLPRFYRHFTLLMLCFGAALWIAGILLRIRASHLVFAALLLAVFVCSASLGSIARELNVVFPMFIILAVLTRRFDWMYEPALAVCFTVFSFCTLLSANGHWMR